MDLNRFDALTRALSGSETRRQLLGLVAAVPVLGGVLSLVDADDALAKDRRRRRKQRHKRRKNHGIRQKGCRPKSKATVCAGQCGPVKNRQTCGKSFDCGSCACTPSCGVCFTCLDGPNTPGSCVVDPQQVGEACGQPGQVCQANGDCPSPPVITSFTANPTAIDRGATPPETALLSWATSAATTCTLDGGSGPQAVACTDSLEVGPDATATYTLRASGPGGSVSAEATVTVDYCHSITSPGHTCPTSETQFCRGQPISATSYDDARAACEACLGVGQCQDTHGCVSNNTNWSGAPSATNVAFQFRVAATGEILGGAGSTSVCVPTGARWAP